MARKKQEVALQLEINAQEEWEELMQKEGLIVVDVFQDWCGPCKAVLSFFRRIKNEIGDDFLHFATAKCDTIDSLDKYRGRCEPCFLIYGGGSLVAVIRGANPPALEQIIKAKLEEEHKVMKGEIERKEIKDPNLSGIDVEEKVEKEDKEVEEIEQEVTLALIKPDVVKAGKLEEIISKLKERGIEILAQQERNLTEEEARSFYHHMENSEYFENLITFLSSGPSHILVLAKGDEGIIREFRELIGPKVFEEAKEKAPDSFRAVYGTSSIENAIHGADDKESVNRELAFFFPDFVAPKIARKKQEESHQQRTLALIRPAAFAEFKESILEKIKASGFKIEMQKEVKLTKEEAELFYKDHAGKPYFEELTLEMSKGTLLALALEKQHAVSGFRGILGPKSVEKAKENDPSSLRAQFSKEDITINLIHGSDTEENAQNELKYFFPVEQTIAAIKPDGADNREEIVNRIVEARFKIVKTSELVMTKEMAEEFYADQKDQEYFEELVAHMQSGPSMFMVLSREDAIRGWRSIMGPKDPNIAAESYPDSIRGIYGKDVKENAVYGSVDGQEVARVMNLIFGKLEFHEDGTLLDEYVTVEEKAEVSTPEDNVEISQSEGIHEETTETLHEDHDQTIHDDGHEGDEVTHADQSADADHEESEHTEPYGTDHAQPTEPHTSVPSSPTEKKETILSEKEEHSENVEHTESEVKHESEHVTSEHTASHTNLQADTGEGVESENVNAEEPVEEKTEKVADSSVIVEDEKEGTEIPQATEGSEDLPQETTVVDDDDSLIKSLGGPMAAGMHHEEEPVTLEKVVDEEKSETVREEPGDSSHLHVGDTEGVDSNKTDGKDDHVIEEKISVDHSVEHSGGTSGHEVKEHGDNSEKEKDISKTGEQSEQKIEHEEKEHTDNSGKEKDISKSAEHDEQKIDHGDKEHTDNSVKDNDNSKGGEYSEHTIGHEVKEHSDNSGEGNEQSEHNTTMKEEHDGVVDGKDNDATTVETDDVINVHGDTAAGSVEADSAPPADADNANTAPEADV